MKFPERMIELAEKSLSCSGRRMAGNRFAEYTLKPRPFARQCGQGGDMPFGSYQTGPQDALRNASRFLKEAGMDAVKIESYAEIRRFEKTGQTEQHRLSIIALFVQKL